MRKQMRKHRSLEERFWSKVEKTPGCWLWTRGVGGGYGVIGKGGRGETTLRAHRLSWELANGPIPKGLCVSQRCGNKLCVNPAHLYLLTLSEALEKAWLRGRFSFRDYQGENHPRSKLSNEQVREMRRLYAEGGCSQRELAKEYDVTQPTVSMIINGKTRRAELSL